jgi:hypothetical protein
MYRLMLSMMARYLQECVCVSVCVCVCVCECVCLCLCVHVRVCVVYHTLHEAYRMSSSLPLTQCKSLSSQTNNYRFCTKQGRPQKQLTSRVCSPASSRAECRCLHFGRGCGKRHRALEVRSTRAPNDLRMVWKVRRKYNRGVVEKGTQLGKFGARAQQLA